MTTRVETQLTETGVVRLEGRKPAAVLNAAGIEVHIQLTKENLSFPRTIQLGSIPDVRLRVIRPIAVELSREGESVIASVPELEEFGQGSTSSDALNDLGFSLAELLLSLQENQSRLGPDLVRLLGKLQTYLVPRSH
jgi:hypothetical protein